MAPENLVRWDRIKQHLPKLQPINLRRIAILPKHRLDCPGWILHTNTRSIPSCNFLKLVEESGFLESELSRGAMDIKSSTLVDKLGLRVGVPLVDDVVDVLNLQQAREG